MTNQITYKCWNFDFIHYEPSTVEGGGEIKWNKISQSREIYLPSEVTDPVAYLQRSGENSNTDLLEYNYFSVVNPE